MTQTERKLIAQTIDSLLCWQGMVSDYLRTPAAEWDQAKYEVREAARNEALNKLRAMGIPVS